MRLVNWQVMDKDAIVDLIVKHNASTGALAPEVARRVRNKLMAMDAAELWAHIKQKYNNELYEPDVMVVDPRELKAREHAAQKVVVRHETVKHTPVVVQGATYNWKPEPIESAHNDLYSKSCVRKCDRYGEQLVIIMADMSMIKKLRHWIKKHYPTVWVTIIGEEQ